MCICITFTKQLGNLSIQLRISCDVRVCIGRVGRRTPESEATTSYLMEVNNTGSARKITTAALDDTDALMSASKRHDQQLLSDINARLVDDLQLCAAPY